MPQVALGYDTEIILKIEAYREASRIRRQRQNEEANALRKIGFEFLDGAAGAKLCENGFNLFSLDSFSFLFIDEAEEQALGLQDCLRIGRVSPEYGRGIADLDTMTTVALEKMIERRCISESGGFRDGGILALFMAIRLEGIEIEGDDRGARRLRAPNAFDGRMQSCHRRMVAGDKAGSRRFLARRSQASPQLARGRTIVDHDIRKPLAFEREDNILVFHVFRPAELGKLICAPFIEKTQDGLQSCVRR